MLLQPCEKLDGIGPAIAAKLQKCGIFTIKDLLFHLPFRYQDRTRVTAIQDLRTNDWAVVAGRVCKVEVRFGKRPALYCLIEDKTGILKLRFFHFNQQQIKNLKESEYIRVFGEVKEFSRQREMIHPEYQLLKQETDIKVDENLTPIYPSTQGLTQTKLRQLISNIFSLYQNDLSKMEWMDKQELTHFFFTPIGEALQYLHTPPPELSITHLENGSHPALQRVIFDELLARKISMNQARAKRASLKAPALLQIKDPIQQFLQNLPFTLTEAQHRVFSEISNDLTQTQPMLRLVQGDVGSGKTAIAALAALQAVVNGYQIAFMAPTELLSEQHEQALHHWFKPFNVSIHRLSGKMPAKTRSTILNALKSHECHILVGTHALFQEQVEFARLGLVIIDEQHRFGVEQRYALQKKGEGQDLTPHQLLLTATPIPRTLAMTQFAHLDLSILDELPPGRTPIITAVMPQEKRLEVIHRLHTAISQHKQAYWVCTLIEDSEKLQCMAATASADYLQSQLPNARIGLIHGRMKAAEKEQTMMAFKQGLLDILVATTVIEVGVDVPNASLMIIENAERLGLSQLHQLRGRVGRGNQQSHCLLLYQGPLSQQGIERLSIMRETSDGFLIAEKDLALRGSGEFLGTRQTGYQQFKVASLPRDEELLLKTSEIAQKLIEKNPEIAQEISSRWLGHSSHFLQA